MFWFYVDAPSSFRTTPHKYLKLIFNQKTGWSQFLHSALLLRQRVEMVAPESQTGINIAHMDGVVLFTTKNN